MRFIIIQEEIRQLSHILSDGHTETIKAGETAYALDYEVEDMQNYVLNGGSEEYLTYSRDVMSVLTDIRKQWGMIYPFE